MNKLDKNLSKILYIQLAIENYELNTGIEHDEVNHAFEVLNKFRTKRKNLTEEEQFKESKEVLDLLNTALNVIGRDKFIFYEDGDINYKWDMSFKKKGGNTNDSKLSKYEVNLNKILKIKNTIESYELSTGHIDPLSNEAIKELENLEKLNNKLAESEKEKLSLEILIKFNKILNIIENNK